MDLKERGVKKEGVAGEEKKMTDAKEAQELESMLSSGAFTLRFSCSETSSALLASVSRSRGDGA